MKVSGLELRIHKSDFATTGSVMKASGYTSLAVKIGVKEIWPKLLITSEDARASRPPTSISAKTQKTSTW